jgi:hypothetical protein
VILVLVFQENAINNNKIQLMEIKINQVAQMQLQIQAQTKIINNSNINSRIKIIMMKDFLKAKNF